MKKIKLTQGKYALVDDEDYELVNQFKWFAQKRYKSENYYGARSKVINKKKRQIFIHQFVMGTVGKGYNFSIDHIDHNTLNNQKSNLRICNTSQNLGNQSISKNNSTGYKGVVLSKKHGKYHSRITINRRRIHIGFFKSSIEAAKAYNQKALELFGEFAFLNKV